MNTPVTLTIAKPLFDTLHAHLFPGDGDEHAAVIAAGVVETSRGTRLLARDIFLAKDGKDFIPGTRSYRLLTAEFVAQQSDYCAAQNLCYLSAHSHGPGDSVGFSTDDLKSNERGYPALLDITHGGPVGALVFATEAVAGDIWAPQGRFELAYATIVGPQIKRLYPTRRARPPQIDLMYDRQGRLFGDIGQYILSNLKVGIIGLGGGGSLLNEWLARLGIGHIVAVDHDRIDYTNLPRVVGATHWDALAFLAESRTRFLPDIAKHFARYKVHIAQRVARQAKPSIRYEPIVGDVVDESVAQLLRDADFLFLASDSIRSRLVFNALVHQYLIPGAMVGAKVAVDQKTHEIGEIHTASRLVLPYPEGGCLECNGLISPEKVRLELLSENEVRKQRYVDDDGVKEPSVITLNALSAAPAANDLMMMFMNLYYDKVQTDYLMNFVRERTLYTATPQNQSNCLDCGTSAKSRRARGDRARLPCREKSTRSTEKLRAT